MLRGRDKKVSLLRMDIEESFHFVNFFVQLIPADGRHVDFAFPQRTLQECLMFGVLKRPWRYFCRTLVIKCGLAAVVQ